MKAEVIAGYFLTLQDDNAGELISNMKLQKLLYYTQGLYLALKGTPLFKENIKAWKYGPVVPEVYHIYKKYDSGAIPRPKNFNFEQISKGLKEFLDEVYQIFGQFSAWKLSCMTHEEAPYKISAPTIGIITHESMKEYFKQFIKK